MEEEIKSAFQRYFDSDSFKLFRAPGRVNLIGEHTDYNDGFVLPTAINYSTLVAGEKRDDSIIEAVALDERDIHGNIRPVTIRLDEPIEPDSTMPWSNYLRGVVKELKAVGISVSGAQLVIKGDVPRGAGLSSSAALENALIKALTQLSGITMMGTTAAKVGQAAENNFVGCQCGIMDQLVSALGRKNNALLIDCRSLATKAIAIPENSSIVVINSNVTRGLVDSEYNTRRLQCEAAAEFFNKPALRDVSLEELEAGEGQLEPIIFRRARHVISENERTLLAAEALEAGDLAAMSQLMYASHQSMKNDFDITVPAIDTLVDIVRAVVGDRGGVRMTGGGFGGCIVALAPKTLEKDILASVERHYTKHTGLVAHSYVCSAESGAFSP